MSTTRDRIDSHFHQLFAIEVSVIIDQQDKKSPWGLLTLEKKKEKERVL